MENNETKISLEHQLIEKHLHDWDCLSKASIKYFAESGKVSGSLYIVLKEMMNDYADQKLESINKELELYRSLLDDASKEVVRLEKEKEDKINIKGMPAFDVYMCWMVKSGDYTNKERVVNSMEHYADQQTGLLLKENQELKQARIAISDREMEVRKENFKWAEECDELVKLLEKIELTLINSDGIDEIWFNREIKSTLLKWQTKAK